MSRENVLYIAEAIASMDPEDIDGDTVSITVDTDIGETSFSVSLVGFAADVVSYLKEMH